MIHLFGRQISKFGRIHFQTKLTDRLDISKKHGSVVSVMARLRAKTLRLTCIQKVWIVRLLPILSQVQSV